MAETLTIAMVFMVFNPSKTGIFEAKPYQKQ